MAGQENISLDNEALDLAQWESQVCDPSNPDSELAAIASGELNVTPAPQEWLKDSQSSYSASPSKAVATIPSTTWSSPLAVQFADSEARQVTEYRVTYSDSRGLHIAKTVFGVATALTGCAGTPPDPEVIPDDDATSDDGPFLTPFNPEDFEPLPFGDDDSASPLSCEEQGYKDEDKDGFCAIPEQGRRGKERFAAEVTDKNGKPFDCNDTDPDIYPGAEEVMEDGIDNDCDGTIDNGSGDDDTVSDDDSAGDDDVTTDDDTTGDDDTVGDDDSATDDDSTPPGDDDTTPAYVDTDEDGYSVEAGDCDDEDPTVNPGATDSPGDGIDQNCDGEDAIIIPPTDADGDGFSVESDCNDEDPNVYPGASEICNGLDENCDEVADDGLEINTYYTDADGDGFGNAAETVTACEQPVGFVPDETDCDDANPAINPGHEEVCDNGLDDDCDDDPNQCQLPEYINLADADAKLSGVATNDNAGYSAQSAGDVNGDGYDDVIVGAPLQDTGSTDAGAAYVIYGPFGDMLLSSAGATIVGDTASDYTGINVASAGDVNGDGFGDILVGASWRDTNGSKSGSAFLYYGPLSDTLSVIDADIEFYGIEADSAAGSALSPAGDMDGDGYDDFLIGSYLYNGGQGAVYLIRGLLTSGVQSLAGAYACLLGATATDHAGASVSGNGDVNGDGYPDIIIGAYGSSTNGGPYVDIHLSSAERYAGAAYIVQGPVEGALDLSSATATLLGESSAIPIDSAGMGVSISGDLDGDGFSDIVVGAPLNNRGGTYGGSTYVFYGPVSGTHDLSEAAAIISGNANDHSGTHVAIVPDMNGDGKDELLISATEALGDNDGHAALFYGPIYGNLSLDNADVTIDAEVSGSRTSSDVASAGDTDGDGIPDLLIGAYAGSGAAYLINGTGE